MEIGITITDLDGTIIYTNPVEAMTHGWNVEELIGKKSRIFAPPDIWKPMTPEEISCIRFFTRESVNIKKDGTVFPVRLTSDVVLNDKNEPVFVVNACVDLSSRRKIEEVLFKLSITDPLTGLFNRRYFIKKIAEEASRARRVGYTLSLIMLDLDDFKAYNDAHGHLAGDDVLVEVAGIIANCVRKDTDTAYRYGGDEFIVILPNSDGEKARCVAGRISQRVAEQFSEIGISAGIAELNGGASTEDLIRGADAAMYADKAQKKRASIRGGGDDPAKDSQARE